MDTDFAPIGLDEPYRVIITRDPIGFKGGINLYAAMGMNPILNRDPLGLKMISGMDCQEIKRELQPVV